MKLAQLETFVVVAEELHFRRAAERLYTQPSTVSTQISQLEAEYGTQLFIRNSRNVELSPAGEQLLAIARRVLDGIAELESTARSLAQPENVRLTVGVMDEGLAELTEIVRSNFVARYPNSIASSAALDYQDFGPALETRRVDVIITVTPDVWFDSSPVAHTPLFSEGRVVVLPTNHPLAERTSTTVEELLDEPFLRIDGIADELHDLFMLADRRDLVRSPDVHVEASHMHNILNHVAASTGLLTVTHGVARFYPRPDIAYVPVIDLAPAVLYVTRRSDDTRPHVLGYIDECVKAVRTSLDLIPTAVDATGGQP